jgi:hypothetical protein
MSNLQQIILLNNINNNKQAGKKVPISVLNGVLKWHFSYHKNRAWNSVSYKSQ